MPGSLYLSFSFSKYDFFILLFRQISTEMLTVANGIRPKPPHEKIVVLLTDGISTTVPVKPDNVDRLIVIGLGPGLNASLPDLASSPEDYLQVNNTCEIISFLNDRLLCRQGLGSINASSPLCRMLSGRDLTGPSAGFFQDPTRS